MEIPPDLPIKKEMLAALGASRAHVLIVTDRFGHIVWVNDGFTQLSGFSAAEAIGQRPGALLQGPNSDRATIARMSERLGREEGFSDVQIVNYHKSGTPYWVHIEVMPVRDDAGILTHYFAIENEITKRRDEIKFEELFQETFNGTSNIVLLCDSAHRLTFVNEAFVSFAGLEQDKLLGKKLFPLFYGMGVDQATLSALDGMMRTGARSAPFEIVKFDREGRKRTLEAEIFPRRNSVGHIVGFVMFERDISRQRFLEALLNKSEYRFRVMTETVPGMVFQWMAKANGEQCYQWVSPRSIDMFGIDPQDLLNDPRLLAVHAEDESEWRRGLALSIQELGDWSFFGRLVPPNGKAIWVHSVARPLRQPDGAVLFNGIMVDISAQRQLEEELLRSTREEAKAIAANQAKDEFIATLSHEIRTPMTGIMGMLSIAIDQSGEGEMRRTLETAHNAAVNLMGIIQPILDYARIESGIVSVEKIDFSLRAVIDGVTLIFRDKMAESGNSHVIDIVATLPDMLYGDEAKLRQILLNLIGNACKFTQNGRISIRVTGEPQGDSEWLMRFEVSDNGIGIARDAIPSLFERFTQADSSHSRRFGGTGLGLAICRQLVRLLGGEIGVTSEPGEGSRFWFTLPLQQGAAPNVTAPQHRLAIPTSSLQILVVDDNQINRILLAKLLQRAGHSVCLATDGLEALSAVTLQPFDAILMDMQMPNLDGISATRRLKAMDPPIAAIPVIGLTANARYEDRQACLESGMEDVLLKPINLKILDQVLRQLPGAAGNR